VIELLVLWFGWSLIGCAFVFAVLPVVYGFIGEALALLRGRS
jgi:hypothetical protein